MAAQKKNAGKTPPSIIEKNDKREIHNDIDSLNKKIELLEKIIEDKDYIIDDLVLERDQISDNRYAQRIKCESMQRQLTKATERIKELEKENKEKREAIADKDYIIDDLVLERDEISDDRYAQRIKCESTQQQLTKACERIKVLEKEPIRVKNNVLNYDITNSFQEENVRLRRQDIRRPPEQSTEKQGAGDREKRYNTRSSDVDQVDSGISIDMESLNQVIEKKIDRLIDEKLQQKQFRSSCEKFPQIISANKTKECPDIREAENRERNVIIHGLKEDDRINDYCQITEIFEATNTKYAPLSICRLGSKKVDKIRPILLRMESTQQKEELMSKLWMLKNLKQKYLSITNDYTLNERNIIKKYVEEANARNTNGTKDYIWKVRGTPKEGMKLIKIAKQN